MTFLVSLYQSFSKLLCYDFHRNVLPFVISKNNEKSRLSPAFLGPKPTIDSNHRPQASPGPWLPSDLASLGLL